MAQLENAKSLNLEREAFLILQVLRDHLPDREIDLFRQSLGEPEFALFSKLPIELQLQIWRFLPYNPQRFHFCTPDEYPGIWNFWDGVPDVNKLCCPPNLIGLQVSKQSRQETLRYYSLLFEHTNGFKRYFDPYKDQILTTSLFPRLSQLPYEWHRYYFEEISGERWKGECTVQYLEIHEFAWWNVAHPGTSQSIPDFRGIGHCFQALVKLIIYPRDQCCRRNISNFYNPRVLEECYEFFDREFTRAKEELNWDGYKIPEISIVFPSNGDPKLTRLEQIDQARRNYNLLAG